jgi:hypothetical protein
LANSSIDIVLNLKIKNFPSGCAALEFLNSSNERIFFFGSSRAQLTAYLTNDDHDRRAMQGILNEVYGGTDRHKPKIFSSRFIYQNHRVVRARTSEPLLMDYIQVAGYRMCRNLRSSSVFFCSDNFEMSGNFLLKAENL